MPKTLADMTPRERANCRGMWARTFSGYTGVIAYENGKQAYLIIPEFMREETFPLSAVLPRFDLPRAWAPNGTPPAGKWETCDSTDIFLDGIGTPTGHAYSKTTRRFVTEWETVPNA